MEIFILIIPLCFVFEFGQCFGNFVNVSTFSSIKSEERKSQKYHYNDIRLPKSIIPLEYDIFLHPNLSEWSFFGKVEIRCEVRETTDFIVLHSKDLIIADTTVRALSSNRIIEINRRVNIDYAEQLYIEVEPSLPKDTEIYLTLVFEGILDMGLSGFYVSQYLNANNRLRSVASTQFQPIDARKAFPCFDEPELKANFSISIVREKDQISLFNMPLIQSLPYGEDLMLDTFQQTVKMSTYLVAFAVCKYASKSKQTESGINVTVYSPEDQIGNVDYSLNVTLTIIDFYNSLYDIPYPLPKLDMIAIPQSEASAMENWGLVTYRRNYLNVSEETSYENKFRAAFIVSHEIAHQWFGNIVTMKWWNDIWLNEGMASYMSYLGLEAFNKEWTLENTFTEKLLSMVCEDATRTRSLNQPLDTSEFDNLFTCVTYNKGASILRMVRSILGKQPFFNGIKEYLRRHLYSNVEDNDLWEVLSTLTKDNVDVSSIMKTWMSERSYPVVTVIRDGPTVHLSQDVFISDHSLFRESEPQSPPRWCIPFIYGVLDQNGRFSTENILLCEKTGILQINNDTTLVKGNYGDDGYYRVNYDHESWKALAEQLKENHTIFPSGDRAQLLSDVLAFTSNKILNNTSNARALMNYLEKERSYLPWLSVTLGMSMLVQNLEVTKENEYGLLVRKCVDMATNALADVGCRENKNEKESLGRVRGLLISMTTLCRFAEPKTAMRKVKWTFES